MRSIVRVLILLVAAGRAGAVTLSVDRVAAGTATEVVVAVKLASGGAAVGGAQADLVFDNRAVRLAGDASCRVGDAISDQDPACDQADLGGKPCKSLSRNLTTCDAVPLAPGCPQARGDLSRFRGLVASTRFLSRSVIPDGATLFVCRFEIVDRSRLPALVSLGRPLSSGPLGEALATTGTSGSISVNALTTPLPTWTIAPSATPTLTRTQVPTRTPTLTRTPTATRTTTATFTITATSTITPTPEPAVEIEVRASQVADKVTVPVYLHSHGLSVGGFQSDLLFDTRLIRLARPADCRINPAIGTSQPGCDLDPVEGPCKTLTRNLVLCGEEPLMPGCEGQPGYVARFRAIIAATAIPNTNVLPDGVMYTCEFSATGPAHIENRGVVASTPTGGRLPSVADDGYIGNLDEGEAGAPPTWTPIYPTAPPTHTAAPAAATPTAAATRTATPVLARLWLREAPEAADGEALVELVLDTAGEDVGGMQSDLIFDGTALALYSISDCKINPEIGDRDPNCEEDTADIIKPCKTLNRNLVKCGEQPTAPGCEGQGADRWRFRGIVAATAVPNNIPIPDGSVLYTCRFRIVDANHLSTRIEQINAVLASPTGERLAVAPSSLTLGAVPTPTPQVMGYPCTAGDQCASGFCVDATCCSTASCPPNQYCDTTESLGECSPRYVISDGCNADSDCLTGNCDVTRPDPPEGLYGVCGPVRTPTPRAPGDTCGNDSECTSGTFCNEAEGGLCCEMKVCPAGFSCRVPGQEGSCRPVPTATRRPTPTGTLGPAKPGELCSERVPERCTTGYCVDGACCEDGECLGTDRCDVSGFAGRCFPPLFQGDACRKNSDCEVGLLCTNDDGTGLRCTLRAATPTAIPMAPASPTYGLTFTVERHGGDDGCSTTPRGGSAGWVALGLFALFASRRRRS